jgi:hypothetical protein
MALLVSPELVAHSIDAVRASRIPTVGFVVVNLIDATPACGRLLPVDPLRTGRSAEFDSANLADGRQLVMMSRSGPSRTSVSGKATASVEL